MAKKLVRYRDTNAGVMVQARNIGLTSIPIRYPLLYMVGCLSKMLFHRGTNNIPDSFWSDYSDLNNSVFDTKSQLNWHAHEIVKLIAELKEQQEWVKKERESIGKRPGDEFESRGVSAPFYVDTSRLGPIGVNFKDPGDEWKKVVQPRLYGGERKTAADGKTASGKNFRARTGQGGVQGAQQATFIPPDMGSFAFTFEDLAKERGSSSVITYKEPNKGKGGNGGKGAFNPLNRKKQAGESPEGHQQRIQMLNAGMDVSDWSPF